MKKILSLVLCAIMLMGMVPTALAVNEDIEGKITIYTSIYQFVIDMIVEDLKAEFPNLEVDMFYGGTGKLQEKLTGEMVNGELGCDMMLVAEPAYSLELKEGGWLHQFEVENVENILRFPYDTDGYWYPVRVCNMVLAYHPEKFAEFYPGVELPKTFKDFAENTALKGKISMGNPLTSGTTMAAVAALTDKYGYDYLTALGENDVMIESGSVALEKLNSGECAAIMILEESVLKAKHDAQKQGGESKITCIYPEDGVILIPSTVMIVDEEKSANMNVEACEAVANWLLSEPGQKLILEGYMHSVFAGMKEVPFESVDTDGLIEKDMGVDWVRCYTQRDEIRTEFQERVTVD